MLEIDFAELSDPGLTRDHNEDFLGRYVPSTPEQARSHGWLFALADGVGGHDRGEVASRVAVEALTEGFRKAPARESHTSLLPKLVQAANSQVFQAGLAFGPGGSDMATTLVACALRFDRAIVSHAGDSRCYLIRGNLAVSLTRDHTVANILSRSLGANLFVNVESSEHQLNPGDTLLLCSDGLHHSVTAADMAAIVGSNFNLDRAVSKLVDLAKERDGSDNISVQLIRVRNIERVGLYRGRHYKIP